MKVLISDDYGGFTLSANAIMSCCKRKGVQIVSCNEDFCVSADGEIFDSDSFDRNDVDLIAVVEEIGLEEARYKPFSLKIVEIPDDVDFEISSYDGKETICETHRKWS